MIFDLVVDQFSHREYISGRRGPKRGVTVYTSPDFHGEYDNGNPATAAALDMLVKRAFDNSSGVAFSRKLGLKVAFDWDAYR